MTPAGHFSAKFLLVRHLRAGRLLLKRRTCCVRTKRNETTFCVRLEPVQFKIHTTVANRELFLRSVVKAPDEKPQLPRNQPMSMLRVLICGLLVATCSTTLTAGERGPDKYQGTVLFDRWDACSIYSGVSVMYVSKSVKEKLRPLNGQRVLINAKEVYQPKNPGDGLIKELEVVWPIPKNSREWVKFDGLTLKITVSSDKEGKPVVTIKLRNTSDKPIEILSDEWTPTLFTRGEAKKWTPYDDASFALVTRVSFQIGGDEPRWHGKHWTIGKENALPRRFMLEAKSDRTVAMQFDLPDGEYDFICGYGSHQGFASGKRQAKHTASKARYH